MIRLEITGIFFVANVGSFLHFIYEASGRLWWGGMFSAMNESVWGHLKLAYWPSLIWTLGLGALLKPKYQNLWTATTFALVATPVIIAVGYYAYTALLGHHTFVIDLMLFVAAISRGQFLAF